MRPTCLLCVRKHLGKAEALMNEARMGYPHHAGLAIGNLSEAADEAMADFPELAEEIRKHWKRYEMDEDRYQFPTTEILKKVEELLQEVRLQQKEDEKARLERLVGRRDGPRDDYDGPETSETAFVPPEAVVRSGAAVGADGSKP